jgi:hypothetical protein
VGIAEGEAGFCYGEGGHVESSTGHLHPVHTSLPELPTSPMDALNNRDGSPELGSITSGQHPSSVEAMEPGLETYFDFDWFCSSHSGTTIPEMTYSSTAESPPVTWAGDYDTIGTTGLPPNLTEV